MSRYSRPRFLTINELYKFEGIKLNKLNEKEQKELDVIISDYNFGNDKKGAEDKLSRLWKPDFC